MPCPLCCCHAADYAYADADCFRHCFDWLLLLRFSRMLAFLFSSIDIIADITLFLFDAIFAFSAMIFIWFSCYFDYFLRQRIQSRQILYPALFRYFDNDAAAIAAAWCRLCYWCLFHAILPHFLPRMLWYSAFILRFHAFFSPLLTLFSCCRRWCHGRRSSLRWPCFADILRNTSRCCWIAIFFFFFRVSLPLLPFSFFHYAYFIIIDYASFLRRCFRCFATLLSRYFRRFSLFRFRFFSFLMLMMLPLFSLLMFRFHFLLLIFDTPSHFRCLLLMPFSCFSIICFRLMIFAAFTYADAPPPFMISSSLLSCRCQLCCLLIMMRNISYAIDAPCRHWCAISPRRFTFVEIWCLDYLPPRCFWWALHLLLLLMAAFVDFFLFFAFHWFFRWLPLSADFCWWSFSSPFLFRFHCFQFLSFFSMPSQRWFFAFFISLRLFSRHFFFYAMPLRHYVYAAARCRFLYAYWCAAWCFIWYLIFSHALPLLTLSLLLISFDAFSISFLSRWLLRCCCRWCWLPLYFRAYAFVTPFLIFFAVDYFFFDYWFFFFFDFSLCRAFDAAMIFAAFSSFLRCCHYFASFRWWFSPRQAFDAAFISSFSWFRHFATFRWFLSFSITDDADIAYGFLIISSFWYSNVTPQYTHMNQHTHAIDAFIYFLIFKMLCWFRFLLSYFHYVYAFADYFFAFAVWLLYFR